MKSENKGIAQVVEMYRSAHALSRMKVEKSRLLQAEFSLYGHKNHCTCQMDDENEIIAAQCDCTWWKDYGDCPHIRLCQEFIKEHAQETYENVDHRDIEMQVQAYEERKHFRALFKQSVATKHLLFHIRSRYEAQLMQSIQRTRVQIEPCLHTENGLSVFFRIGNEYRYIIKSIPKFLHALKEHAEVSYGKQLHFVHQESAFDEHALAQIAFMRKYVNRNEYYEDVKMIPLNKCALDEFFRLYVNQKVPFSLMEGQAPFTIQTRQENSYMIFHLTLQKPCYFGEKHVYYVEKTGQGVTLYRKAFDEEGICVLFIKQLMKADIVVAKEEYPALYKYGISPLLHYLPLTISLPDEEEEIEHMELYGDINEQNRICFSLFYYTASNRWLGFDSQRMLSYEQDIVEAYIKQYASVIDYEHHMAYMDEKEDATLDFLNEGLMFLSRYCDIYISEQLKKLGTAQKYHIQVGVRIDHGLLSLHMDSMEIPEKELSQVLLAYHHHKKFYRFQNGTVISLVSEELHELYELLNDVHMKMTDIKEGTVQMETYRMFSLLYHEKKTEFMQIHKDTTFLQYMEHFYQPETYPLSKHYESLLRDYQKAGVRWLCLLRDYGFHGILADDMGLGKTLQILAYLDSCKRNGPSLVVCPASLVYNWADEADKFAGTCKVICIVGNKEERCALIQSHEEYDIWITSYDYVRRDIELYEQIRFDTLILDEAHYIKNPKTLNAQNVKRLTAEHRLALTGTPIENTLAELWSIFDFLMPEYLYPYPIFQRYFEMDIVKHHDEAKKQELKQLISPFILRRTKQEVLKELPEKIETIRLISFSKAEKKRYLEHMAMVHSRLERMGDMWGGNKVQVLAMLTKLRQLCCEPRLLYEDIDHISSKLSDCLNLLEELQRNHKKVLVFSSFVAMLNLLAEECKRKQISYVMLTGRMNKEMRKQHIDRFQRDDTTAFLISLKAGGTGINLTAAEVVIHMDPWWNTSSQNQATDRAYRMGQLKNVQVFQLIMKDSIEEKIMKLQHQKKALADDFMEGNDGGFSFMSREEVLALVTEN